MIHMGFGVVISPANKAALDRGLELARETGPAFAEQLKHLKVSQLKAMVAKVRPRAGMRGMSVRQHYVDALMSWHTGECLKAAGYVQEHRSAPIARTTTTR